ncbi:MAG TPA: DUF3606 domain-containing protein [Burkholderiales bacterium]|nr:DUF3606 domain-containing protein [Burkholderiales bacterium]
MTQIDLQDAREVRQWCERLHASEDELRRAVEQVGTDPHKVREHLFGGFSAAGPTS